MIDTHVHFWKFDADRDDWITADMAIIRNDFLPKDIATVYNDLNIDGCIAVQANQSETETSFLLNLAQQNAVIKGVVGWTDLKNPALSKRLQYWKNFELIKGWRHVLQAEPDEFITHKNFIAGVKSLKEFGFTYDLLCYHHQLKAINLMVDQLDEQPLVLDHCGKPDVKNQNLKAYEQQLRILAEKPHVYCKLSGLLTEADWHNWTEKQIFNCFDIVFKHFGTKRVMYGSDWPVVLVSRPYATWLSLVQKYMGNFTAEEKNQVFSSNGKNFYSI